MNTHYGPGDGTDAGDPAYPDPFAWLAGPGWAPVPPPSVPPGSVLPASVPPPPAPPRRARRVIAGAALVAASAVVGFATASATHQETNGTGTIAGALNGPAGGSSGSSNPRTPGGAPSTLPGTLPGPGTGTTTSSPKASAAQQVGVVDIYTVQKYQQAAAAGTGIVLSSTGEVLTNNHVIDGSTSIKVTVVSTGRSYDAMVVGTAPTKDIAVLRLVGASGLATANLGDSASLAVGDPVTGVGNAGGVGGTPSAARGKVTALGRTITASDGAGSSSETLPNMIVVNAPIKSGDSGGPLYDANDQVIGIDTAASSTRNIGFAIPLSSALAVVDQIRTGVETTSIHIGYPGFLGISVSPSTTSGALVAGALQGGPAAKVGIGAGDVITRVGTTTIRNSTQLRTTVSALEPGATVSVTYTDPSTGSHRVRVTLTTGPAD